MQKSTMVRFVFTFLVILLASADRVGQASPEAQPETVAGQASTYGAAGQPGHSSMGIVASQGQLTVEWLSWEPRVIAVDETDSVRLTVVVEGNPTAVEIALLGGGSVSLDAIGNSTYRVTLSAAQVLGGYQNGDAHSVVGFLDLYEGSQRVSRTNLIVNVRDATMPDVPVNVLGVDIQASPHVVNMRHDDLYLGSAVPPEVLLRLYQFLGDDFDFVAVVEQVVSVNNRFFMGVRNDILGLGLPVYDNGALYGSSNRLQGIIHYPIDSFFDLAETASVHEIAHRWINFLNLPTLAQGGPHWPVSDLAYGIIGFSSPVNRQGMQFPFSLVEQPSGDYLVQSRGPAREFNDLELYLMGMISKEEVSEHFVFQDQNQLDQLHHGGILKAPVDWIGVDDVIGGDGPRVPGPLDAQTHFSVATIILSTGRLLNTNEMAFFDFMAARGEATTEQPFTSGLARGVTKPFFLATGGRGTLSTTVVPMPTRSVLWTDVNCNGVTDAVDALNVLLAVAGLPVSQEEPCPDIGSTVEIPAPEGFVEQAPYGSDCASLGLCAHLSLIVHDREGFAVLTPSRLTNRAHPPSRRICAGSPLAS